MEFIPRTARTPLVPTTSRSATQSLEDKLLSYLGRGCSNEDAAVACGISSGRVSQFLANAEFVEKLTELKFRNASNYVERDLTWDKLEDALLEKALEVLPTLHKPSDIMAFARMANSAQRRAPTSVDQTTKQTQVVNLILPTVATARVITNAQNQVVRAGEQSLVTIQAGALPNLAKRHLHSENLDECLLPAPIAAGAT